MAPGTFLPVMYLATGALMLVWGLGLLRRFGHVALHRVVAFMLFFGGLAPILAGISLVRPQGAEGEIILLGGLLDRFSYAWEFFFPTLLLFSLMFPRRRAILDRFRWLPAVLYLPHVFHLLLILFARRLEPSSIVKSLESSPDFLQRHLSALDTVWNLGISMHGLIFPAVNLLMALVALILLARSEELAGDATLRRQRLFLGLSVALPMAGYLIAEALPVFAGRLPSASWRPHLLSVSVILASGSLGYAAVRHRFLRIRLLARRGILDVTVSLILAIIYLMILDLFRGFFDVYLGNLAPLFEAGVTVFAIILFQPLLSRVESLLDRRLFGHSGDPRRELLRRFAARLGDVRDQAGMEEALAPVLLDVFHIDSYRLLSWECHEPAQRQAMPQWFLTLNAAREGLRRLEEPLRWHEFQDWCRQEELPAPPRDPRHDYVLALRDEANCRGLLLLAPPSDRRRLRSADREHLVLLAGQLAAALRNLSLLGELLEKRILEEEMQLAQNIQLGLLPKTRPEIRGLSLFGTSLPSRQVGGDYYDWLQKDLDLYFVIADVSGKGIPAAMLMATVQASFRAITRPRMEPGTILGELNRIVYENSPRDRFVTLWLGRLRGEDHVIEYASAGHPPPILTRHGGATVPLQEGGMLLGAFPDVAFETHHIPFGEGDRLVCYTDGVSETENTSGEQFSDRRLMELLSQLRGDPEEVVAGLLRDLARFSASGEPDDDCTLLVLRGGRPPTAAGDGAGNA
ncbi:MAG: serine/threonine-protein phosphatase [Candidatus Krumholzibacteriota bacterium]|nr:serine/threonine-protein phosphatase [Candidatus Krumholzibacteriota bacterium]